MRRFAEGFFAEELCTQRLRWNNPNNGPIFPCYCSIVANRTNSFPLSLPRRRAGRARAPPRHRLHFTLHRPLVGEAAQAEQGGAHHRILHRHRVRIEGRRDSGRKEARAASAVALSNWGCTIARWGSIQCGAGKARQTTSNRIVADNCCEEGRMHFLLAER